MSTVKDRPRPLSRAPLVVLAAAALLAPAAGTAAAGTSRAPTPAPATNAVLTWNNNAAQAALGACFAPTDNPLLESRMYAMMHVAIHDALNAIHRRSRPYLLDTHVAGASPNAAVATAARDVLVPALRQLPAPFSDCVVKSKAVQKVEAEYSAAIAAIAPSRARARGIALGKTAARAILGHRARDHSNTELFDSG